MSSSGLHFEASRCGLMTCGQGSLSLHSAYNPETEAQNFIARTLPEGKKPSLILILGPCLGYITAALKALEPRAETACIQYSRAFEGRESASADRSFYFDDSLEPGENARRLSAFLAELIGPDSVSGLALIEWPPAARAFPAEAGLCGLILRQTLDRYASEANTEKTFGRRWILNALRSSLLIERLAVLHRTAAPLVIAASGPSLDSALRQLSPYRGRFVLFAVSSALAALRARGWEPDLVVSTDGGNWSRHHLYPLGPEPAGEKTILASPLTALPSSGLYAERPLLLLDQGFFPENELVPVFGGALDVGGDATVSGTALRTAALATDGPIITAGLDLASFDIRSHCVPNGFDALIAEDECRLNPGESIVFGREWPGLAPVEGAAPWRSSRALALYAGSLSAAAPGLCPGRIFRLEPSPVQLEGFVPLYGAALATLMSDFPASEGTADSGARAAGTEGSGSKAKRGCAGWPGLFTFRDAPPEEERKRFLRKRIGIWRAEVQAAAGLMRIGVLPSGQSRAEAKNPGAGIPDGAMAAGQRTAAQDSTALELFRAVDMPDWAASRRALLRGENPEPVRTNLLENTLAFLDEIEGRLLR